jgi:hypothetical protein
MSSYCTYCGKYKDKADFTREHVIPKRIGGNFEPVNPLLISVCRICNNLAGQYIDAPFTRNFFVHNSRASEAKQYIDLDQKPILPLKYFGVLPEIKFQGKVCEFWLGPSGDLVYHFHEEYASEDNLIVGKPINKKGSDPGFVFLFMRATNPKWHYTIIYSVAENFEGSEIYLGNSNFTNDIIKSIPKTLLDLHKMLLSLNNKSHNAQFAVAIDFEERFLAKIALGLGVLFLNDSFQSSSCADILRKFLWERDKDKRNALEVKMTSFYNGFSDDDSKFMRELFSWKGGHLLALFSLGDYLILYATFYENHMLSMLIL